MPSLTCLPQKRAPGLLAAMSRLAERMIEGLDPFAVKRWSRAHPYRISYTAAARFIELEAARNYALYALPDVTLPRATTQGVTSELFASEQKNTKLTPTQLDLLVYHARLACSRMEGVIVEVGSYRGVTTRVLAECTRAVVYAVDPFALYGGTDEDFALFRASTGCYANIVHIKKTSGEAVKMFKPASVCFIFIDATPGYVNVRHDSTLYGNLLVHGGFIAINNVDNINFPGSRKAAWELATENYALVTHEHDIAVFARRPSA